MKYHTLKRLQRLIAIPLMMAGFCLFISSIILKQYSDIFPSNLEQKEELELAFNSKQEKSNFEELLLEDFEDELVVQLENNGGIELIIKIQDEYNNKPSEYYLRIKDHIFPLDSIRRISTVNGRPWVVKAYIGCDLGETSIQLRTTITQLFNVLDSLSNWARPDGSNIVNFDYFLKYDPRFKHGGGQLGAIKAKLGRNCEQEEKVPVTRTYFPNFLTKYHIYFLPPDLDECNCNPTPPL